MHMKEHEIEVCYIDVTHFNFMLFHAHDSWNNSSGDPPGILEEL